MRKDWIRKRQRKTPPISGIMKLANQTAVAQNLIGNLGNSSATVATSANRILPTISETIEPVPMEGFHYSLAPSTLTSTTVSNAFYSGEHIYGSSMFPAPSYSEPEMTASSGGNNIKMGVNLNLFDTNCALAPVTTSTVPITSSPTYLQPSMFFYGPCPSVATSVYAVPQTYTNLSTSSSSGPLTSHDHFPSQQFVPPQPCSMSSSVYQFDR